MYGDMVYRANHQNKYACIKKMAFNIGFFISL